MHQTSATRLAMVLVVCIAACEARTLLKSDTAKAIQEICDKYGEGTYADVTSPTPLCSTTYIQCQNSTNAFGKQSKKVVGFIRDDLGTIATANGTANISAVFNAFSTGNGGASLPGAIGTLGCNCTAFYEDDEVSARACRVCNTLQLVGLCDPKQTIGNSTYSCIAADPESPEDYFNCGLAGAFFQDAINGTVTNDKTKEQVVGQALESP